MHGMIAEKSMDGKRIRAVFKIQVPYTAHQLSNPIPVLFSSGPVSSSGNLQVKYFNPSLLTVFE